MEVRQIRWEIDGQLAMRSMENDEEDKSSESEGDDADVTVHQKSTVNYKSLNIPWITSSTQASSFLRSSSQSLPSISSQSIIPVTQPVYFPRSGAVPSSRS